MRTLHHALGVLALLLAPAAAAAQQQGLSLEEARAIARRTNPDVAAARAAAAAAAGRARQAGAFPNPTSSYGREQTSNSDFMNAQDIVAVEQPLEIGGQRGARMQAARLRQEAAEARLAAAEAELDFAVARAYAETVAAVRRAELAEQAAAEFRRAVRVTEERYAAGDISGYAARRIRLEAARYDALAAEMRLEERETRLRLAELLGAPVETTLAGLAPAAGEGPSVLDLPPDSVVALALQRSPDLRAEVLETVLDQTAWDHFSSGSAIRRAGRAGFARNVCVALGNWAAPEAVPVLSRALGDPAELVRAHAAWALGEIGSPEARTALEGARAAEREPSVAEELERALARWPERRAGS